MLKLSIDGSAEICVQNRKVRWRCCALILSDCKIFIYFGLSTIYYQFLADPALEVSTLGQSSTTMNPVFTASLLCQPRTRIS
ncbi:hypothetical protein OUZ56_002430 [Daphnia magna]|uniref:Uncharacterized protein n=1 Tax=Daphnia magna TaxID=35525 RepID=A0ABR0A641_9CRUS|nr:hypothetical protein OUZ56_002430 [Daphnia magna]